MTLTKANHEDATKIFVDGWKAYQKILANDYLKHKVLYVGLAHALQRLGNGSTPLALLDLGCGDCEYIVGAVRESGRRLSRFTGVDLTAEALEIDRGTMGAIVDTSTCELDFRQANMMDFAAEGPATTFDAALTSFAAHHLSYEEKGRFLEGVFRQLKPGGVIFVADAFRHPGESRASYLDRFCEFANNSWMELSPQERKHFEDHMREFDFMETVEHYQELATKAGFGPATTIVQADQPKNTFKVVAFTREA